MLSTIPTNENIADIKPYLPGKPIEEVQRELGLANIVKLASNENNWGLPEKIISELSETLKQLYRYPDGGAVALRSKLAAKLHLSKKQIVMGNGSDELLQIIALTYLNPDVEALISEGTFSEYKFVCKVVNCPTVQIPLKNYTYDLDGFHSQISPKTRAIFLCNPNNPTGTYIDEKRLRLFLSKVPSNVVVIIDEAYYEYAYGDDYPESVMLLSKYNNIIVLRTFSKIWSLAGLRLGYALAAENIIQNLNKARQPFNANRLALDAALLVLDQEKYMQNIKEKNSLERSKMIKKLKLMGLDVLDSRANFVFINTPIPAQKIFKKLLAKGIIIRAMDGFGFKNSIRVSIGLPEENDLFIKELKGVLEL